jgi:hypothetical protein
MNKGIWDMSKSIGAAVVAAIVASFAVCTPAASADLDSSGVTGSFFNATPVKANATGFYIAGGVATDAHRIKGEKHTTSIGLDGYGITGRFGYDRCVTTKCKIVAGIFGSIDYSNAQSNNVKAAFSYDAGGRVGIALGGTLVYANAGGSWRDFDNADYSPSGYFFGGGLQSDLGDGFAIILEGREERVSDAGVDASIESIRLFLSKKF